MLEICVSSKIFDLSSSIPEPVSVLIKISFSKTLSFFVSRSLFVFKTMYFELCMLSKISESSFEKALDESTKNRTISACLIKFLALSTPIF